MTHPKKSLKRTLLFTYLLLASFACKLSAFAGVAGRGIDPSVLQANAAGPGAHTDGASALTATTQSAASTAGQTMTPGTQTSAATTAAGAGQMTTQTGSGPAMVPGTQASAATTAAGAGQMTTQTGSGPAMATAGATANASSVSGTLNGAPTGIPETQPVQSLLPPTEEEIAAYFQGAYVTGDSVAYGFQLYANRQKESSAILQSLGFLTRGSFSAHNAFMAISKKSVHSTTSGIHFRWSVRSMSSCSSASMT